jgi:sugar phosphate isomerase/epimerase
MKVAISSASFAGALAGGELTQLEWLEQTASGLGADGIAFDVGHFPRVDAEYVAQLKKVAVDVGLVPLAVEDAALLDPADAAQRDATIALAAGLGALFVITQLPAPGDVPPATFVAAVAAAKAAVKAAKRVNVTLLVTPQPATLATGAAELRHLVSDVDSAWLRYALPAGADRSPLGRRDRELVTLLGRDDDLALPLVDEGMRPWLLLRGDVDAQRIRALRYATARKTLAAASV